MTTAVYWQSWQNSGAVHLVMEDENMFMDELIFDSRW